MFKDKSRVTGKLTVTVFGPDGKVKRYPQNWLQKLLNLPGREMICVNHNIVTDEGDALIADLMSTTPAKTKFDNSNAFIQVGTNWTGTTPKANTTCNTGTGTPEAMDATYPKLKGSFGAANDNVVQYRATFEAGDLNATITEAAILNNVTPASADCLAYAQVTPSAVVSTTDTLQVDWEITFLGA